MTENTTTETFGRFVVTFDADKGVAVSEIKNTRHAKFVNDKGIPAAFTEELAQAEVERVVAAQAAGRTPIFTKKSQVVVNGLVVFTGEYEATEEEATEAPAAEEGMTAEEANAEVAAAVADSIERGDREETAKERKNRLARERRAAAKKAQADA